MEEVLDEEKDEEGNTVKQLLGVHKIFDPMLLEETIQYNEDGNFDRIIAAELAITLAFKLNPIFGSVGSSGDIRINSIFTKKNPRKLEKIFTL